MLSCLSSTCFFESCMYVGAITFLLFSLFYNIFGVYFLIIEEEYEYCYLWLYNLLSLVSYNVFVILFPKTFFFLLLWFFCTIFLFVFGGNQLFYSECYNLENKDFFIYGGISLTLQLLFMFIIPICFFRKQRHEEEELDSSV